MDAARNALGYHLHSLAWYLAVVALFGVLLRRFLPGALGALALLLFTVDDAHLLPVGWISNRNALISTAGGLLGLWMHLEWREARKRQALPLSLASEQLAQQAAGELDSSRLASQRVVVLGARDTLVGMYVPLFWALRGQPLPRSWWPLTLVQEPPLLTRTGPASFELEPAPGGHFLASELEQALRGPAHRLDTGAVVQLEGMRVTVLAADAEGPTRLGFEFEVPLEDPSLVFLRFEDKALRRFTPPPVGTRVALGAAP